MADVVAALCAVPVDGTPEEMQPPVVWALPDAGGFPDFDGVQPVGNLPADCAGVEILGRSNSLGPAFASDTDGTWLQVSVASQGLSGWVSSYPCRFFGPDCVDLVLALPLVEPRLAVDGLPDLVLEVGPVEVPRQGQSCGPGGSSTVPNYPVAIVNRGTAATSPTIEYTDESGQVVAEERIRGLEPGESVSLVNYSETTTVTVDPNGLVPESDETNNQVTLPDVPNEELICV
jgi:hypothetical protein